MDLNNDGRRDILSGSYSRSDGEMAGLFQVLYGAANGKFRKAEVVKGTDGQPLIIPADEDQLIEKICTRPFAVDWDGDGHLDLVVGNFAGSFYWFQGEGQGKFQPKPKAILAGKEPLVVDGHHSDPFAIDWDGDGDLDLLSGSGQGGVYLSENVAGPRKLPQMRPFQVLIKPGRAIEEGEILNEDDLKGPTQSTRVWVADVNGDGKLDLLVGDSVTLIAPAAGVSKEAFKKKHAAWKKALEKASNAVANETDNEPKEPKAGEDFRSVYEQRTEFMNEDRTGFVWLYLRK